MTEKNYWKIIMQSTKPQSKQLEPPKLMTGPNKIPKQCLGVSSPPSVAQSRPLSLVNLETFLHMKMDQFFLRK